VGIIGRGKMKGRGWQGTWLMYFMHMCENRTMKSAEIVLRKGEEHHGE
jgi:hypothetical protein